jgi:hypothetical protein
MLHDRGHRRSRNYLPYRAKEYVKVKTGRKWNLFVWLTMLEMFEDTKEKTRQNEKQTVHTTLHKIFHFSWIRSLTEFRLPVHDDCTAYSPTVILSCKEGSFNK